MSKYGELIELYKSGITDYNEIAYRLGISKETIKNYLYRARKSKKIEESVKSYNIITKYEKVINLYKEGITDYHKISDILNISKDSARTFITRGVTEGLIKREKKEKIETKYEKMIKAYKNGITNRKDLAILLDTTEDTIQTYLGKARREGIIEKTTKTPYEQFLELYKDGITNEKNLASLLNTTEEIIQTYILKAQKQDLIKIIIKEGNEDRKMNKTSNNGKKIPVINEKLIEQIKEMYTLGYPIDIAKSLKIKPSDVYDVIYSLSKEEERNLRVKRIRKIPLCKEVLSNAKTKKITIEQELYQMKMELREPLKRLELAQIYFWLRNISMPEKILDEMISNVFIDKKIRKKIAEERDKIHNEILALRIRNDKRINRDISTEKLCKKYEVKERFVNDVLRKEEEQELSI